MIRLYNDDKAMCQSGIIIEWSTDGRISGHQVTPGWEQNGPGAESRRMLNIIRPITSQKSDWLAGWFGEKEIPYCTSHRFKFPACLIDRVGGMPMLTTDRDGGGNGHLEAQRDPSQFEWKIAEMIDNEEDNAGHSQEGKQVRG